MTSVGSADIIILSSMLISLGAYVQLSRRERTYINILTPLYVVQIPANFLLQFVYIFIFGPEYSTYAYLYVYGTLAIANWSFVLAYSRASRKVNPPSYVYSYHNFSTLSWICLLLACAIYAPVLFEFREFLLDPRQIYTLTRTGYGQETFVSSTLAYLAIIFILFTKSRLRKAFVLIIASGLLILHGSKVQVLSVLLLILLFQVYVKREKIALFPACVRACAAAAVILLLFAMTLPLGNGLLDGVEEISQYSDYTRNAMLVIDSHLPLQYGRLTIGANVYGIIPRVLMPSKPKNFGTFYLAELFYPEWFDADTGSPDFGIGVQYADFGILAMVYLTVFAILNGWLASVFVERLRLTGHPSDFFMVVFLAGIAVMPLGGAGWLFPEAIMLAACMRYASRIGTSQVVRVVRTNQDPMTEAQA